MTNYSSPAARILRATTVRMPVVAPTPVDTAATCFVCGRGEHAPTELHSFWSIAEARHIRYHFPEAVEALEAGAPVAFAYLTVHCWPETPEDEADAEAGLYDDLIGWTLAARILDA